MPIKDKISADNYREFGVSILTLTRKEQINSNLMKEELSGDMDSRRARKHEIA